MLKSYFVSDKDISNSRIEIQNSKLSNVLSASCFGVEGLRPVHYTPIRVEEAGGGSGMLTHAAVQLSAIRADASHIFLSQRG